jgi:uncharacterized RDD family membrane protein YckC
MATPPGPFNPYAAPSPEAELETYSAPTHAGELASLGERFLGRLVDNVVFWALPIIGAVALAANESTPLRGGADSDQELWFGFVVLGLALPVLCLQVYLVTTSGQSVGKKLLRTRIERTDGSRVGFVHGVLLRDGVVFAMQMIPLVGYFIRLVDAFLIFGQTRQTLHDRIADTRVVKA